MQERGGGKADRRYPVAHTSPWFFVVLAVVTVVLVLGGIFSFEPVLRVLHWLAVVL